MLVTLHHVRSAASVRSHRAYANEYRHRHIHTEFGATQLGRQSDHIFPVFDTIVPYAAGIPVDHVAMVPEGSLRTGHRQLIEFGPTEPQLHLDTGHIHVGVDTQINDTAQQQCGHH